MSCCERRTARSSCRSTARNLYERSVARFTAAVAGEGEPAATGEDGIWSLAVAAAALEVRQDVPGRRHRSRLVNSPKVSQ